MIIYEVNLQIAQEIYGQYMEWLEQHVKKMLEFEGFEKAVYLVEEKTDNTSNNNLTIQYYIMSMKNLDSYLATYAKEMRDDGMRKFPGQFTATRRFFTIAQEMFC